MYNQEFVEYLIEITYKRGFEDGVAYADELIEHALLRAVDPGPDMRPYFLAAEVPDSGKTMVRDLIDRIRPGATP